MNERKTQIVTFAVGSALAASGLTPIPLREVLLTAGSSVASMAYAWVLLSWRRGPSTAQPRMFQRAPSPESPAQVPETTPAPSPAVPSAPMTPSPSQPSTSAPPTQPPGLQAQVSAPPSTPATPTPPGYEKPAPEKRRLPSVKPPKIIAPKWIVEHRVPIALIVVGLPLILAGLIIAGLSPAEVLGYGLLIPGVLILGVGGFVLFLQLYRRPVGLRRFCMHCGFQMMTTDVSCGRCHRQPPSGIDTKVCPNCSAVVPAQARFCRDCGAGQPTA